MNQHDIIIQVKDNARPRHLATYAPEWLMGPCIAIPEKARVEGYPAHLKAHVIGNAIDVHGLDYYDDLLPGEARWYLERWRAFVKEAEAEADRIALENWRAAHVGRVYFIEAEGLGLVKIGYSKSGVEGRLQSLQCASPVPLRILATVEGTLQCERALHGHYRNLRVQGEWFRLEDPLAFFIKTLP